MQARKGSKAGRTKGSNVSCSSMRCKRPQPKTTSTNEGTMEGFSQYNRQISEAQPCLDLTKAVRLPPARKDDSMGGAVRLPPARKDDSMGGAPPAARMLTMAFKD